MLHITFSANALAKCQRFNWQIKCKCVAENGMQVKWGIRVTYAVCVALVATATDVQFETDKFFVIARLMISHGDYS